MLREMSQAMRVVGVGLAGVVMLAGSARADALWTEKSPEEARRDTVVMPTVAPLIQKAGAAVVHISINGKMPPGRGGEGFDPFQEFFKRLPGAEMGPQPLRGMGTGFIIRPDGYIVTNAHVVEHADVIEVRLRDDDTPRKAKLVGADSTTDLALIKIDGKDLPVLPLGDSDKLQVGDFVVAIGNPFGLDHSASFGMVSAKGRRDINPSGRSGLYDFIQTDAAINPGNSGGPLIGLSGEVIGINSAVNAAGQGIGFAIPINMAKTLLPQLKDKGAVTRSWLGVTIQRVTPELAQSFGLETPRGALISQVQEDGPSAKGGVEPGDVIVEFEGRRVKDSSDLPLMAATAGVGKTVTVRVIRDGKQRDLKITLAERPSENVLARAMGTGGTATELGMKVSELTGNLRQQLDLPGDFRGVVVRDLEANAAAAQAGVQEGDVIVKLNGRNVTDVPSFLAQARGIRDGQVVRLFVRRGSSGLFLAFRK